MSKRLLCNQSIQGMLWVYDNVSSHRFLQFHFLHSGFFSHSARGWTLVSTSIDPCITWPNPVAYLLMWPVLRRKCKTTSRAAINGMQPVEDIIQCGMWGLGYEGVHWGGGQFCVSGHLWSCAHMWYMLTSEPVNAIFLCVVMAWCYQWTCHPCWFVLSFSYRLSTPAWGGVHGVSGELGAGEAERFPWAADA